MAATDPEMDVSPDVARAFWRLVLVFNGALFALALGAMFLGFEGDWFRGGGLLAAGVGGLAYGYWRYRYERREGAAAPEQRRDG